MRAAGIVCECNPLHGGHRYLLGEARKAGNDVVIAVMSGCFVQRGEAAVADPFVRAEALLYNGADLVVELPFPYSSASAEFFAHAGVEILSRMGVNEIWLGSESGDAKKLSRLASLADRPEMAALYAETVRTSDGTASAYFEALGRLSGEEIDCSPNDILALSYLRALHRLNASVKPKTVKRQGSAYGDGELPTDASFPSATALRKRIFQDGIAAVADRLDAHTLDLLLSAEKNGEAPATLANAERLILGRLRTLDPIVADTYAALGGGLGARLCEAAHKATSLDELLLLAATKKYPTSRLQRGILFAMTETQEADLRSPVAYVRLLGANATGCAFLSKGRKESNLPVVTRRTDIPNTREALCQLAKSEAAWALYSLCFPRAASADSLWRRTPVILT